MKGDKSRLVFRQLNAQPFFYELKRVASEVELVGIEPLDLPQERILQIDPFLETLDRKINMVCKCYINALIQF